MFEYSPPDNFLADKTLLITGASDGIGRTLALTCARYGARLILLGRQQDKLEKLYDEIEALQPGKVMIHPLDFAKAGAPDYQVLAQAVGEQFECLHGLIHNAGMLGSRSPLQYYPEKDWEEVMQVNVNAAFYLTRVLLPYLLSAPEARILFTSSSVGRKGRAYWGAYAVSKFAVEGLMQTLADELAETSSIRVNSLNPGGTRTAMRRSAYPAEDPNSQPAPEELMPVYLYLLGLESVKIHGQALNARDFDPSVFDRDT